MINLMEGTMEMPFIVDLPKREVRKVETAWDRLAALKVVSAEKGQLLPSPFVACLLGVSRQRVAQLLESGKLERVEVHGHPFVTENSLVEWAKAERAKGGRPIKDGSVKGLWKAAYQYSSKGGPAES
jgi:hypothetical protein